MFHSMNRDIIDAFVEIAHFRQYGNETIIKNYVKDQGKTYKQIHRDQLKLFEDFA